MGSTLTTFDSLLKEKYVDTDRVEELIFPDNPLLGMLEKRGDTDMAGSDLKVPLITANAQGIAGVFSTAQGNATNLKSAKWQITAGDWFGDVEIGDKVIQASRNNVGAFLSDKMAEIDSLYTSMGEGLSIYAWSNGGCALGQIATLSTNDFTLVQPETAQNFEINMTVVASPGDGSTATDALRDNGDGTTISAVNRGVGSGSLTSAAAISGLAAGDYLFRQGDFAGNTTVQIMKGVQAFITGTEAPPTLWGITNTVRATDPQRYAGCRVDPSTIVGKTIEERIGILLAQMTGRFKAQKPTAGFLHPEDFQTLTTQLSARGMRPLADDSTKFGYTKIDAYGGGVQLPIYVDRHCPKGVFFALRMENFWISSMGELLHPQNGDGFDMIRRDASTDYGYRVISYPLLACNAPKNSGRISLT